MSNSKLGWYAFNPASSQQTHFQVVSIDGIERLGGTYYFDIDLATKEYGLDLNELLGKPATLSLEPWGGDQRYFHGVMTRVEIVSEIMQDMLLYRIRLEPGIVKLEQTVLNEAYVDSAQGLEISDLIQQVFKRHSLASGQDYSLKLGAPVTRRSFVMQYKESDWNFLSRWMEFEGVFYYFDQGSSTGIEKIVFVDDISSLPTTDITLNYRPNGSIAMDQYKTTMTKFGQYRIGRTQNVELQNYNYRHAQDLVEASSNRSETSWGTNIVFGNDLRSNQQAKSYAKFHTEALSVESNVFQGQTLASTLVIGGMVTVKDHPRHAFNATYRVISIRHKGSQAAFGLSKTEINGVKTEDNYYVAEFEAIPSTAPFRLPLKTPRPYISGYLPAQIESSDGNTASVDKYGRYKVELLFDSVTHDQMKGSAWVRMASPYNGPGQSEDTGFHFPLLRGAEVMLAFMDGDPDQPVIVGVLNNSLTPSSVNNKNPTLNRVVSRLGNELHLDDTPKTPGVRIQSSNRSVSVVMGAFGGRFGRDDS